ncbi:MAG: TolC family protein [Imperialibacter sp.]|uniref:TolC family protein n=1 Tax=Imperialibacter sp. TaxID=2038411 RepID=UPI003A87A15A
MKKYNRSLIAAIAMLGIVLPAKAQELQLSLSEALVLAKTNNKAMQVQLLEEKVSKMETSESRGELLPTLSAQGSYTHYFDRQVIFMPGALVGNENEPVVDVTVGGKNAVNTYLAFQQPLLLESARRQVRTAKLSEAFQEQETRAFKTRMVADVTASYLRALLISESLKLSHQSLERNILSLEDSRSLFRQGKGLKVDTLRSFIAVENLKSSISYLQSQYETTLLHLARVVGLEVGQTIVLTDKLGLDDAIRYLDTAPLSEAEMTASRPDLLQAKLSVEISRSLVSQTKAQKLPTVTVMGAYQLQAQSFDLSFSRWPGTSFLGIQAYVPIFSGNRINSRLGKSSIRLQQGELALKDLSEKAAIEVATHENSLREGLRQLEIHAKTVEAAKINFAMVNERFQSGLSSRLELTDAELALTESRMNQLQAFYKVRIAKLEYDQALGLLSE